MSEPTRGKFTYDPEKGLIPFEEKRPVHAHYFIPDEIPGGIQSMADGKMYTSKSELRASYRRLGKIEIGNNFEGFRKPEEDPARDEQLEQQIEQAYYKLRDGNADLSEETLERCRIINHNAKYYNYDRREYDEHGNLREPE